MKKLIEKLRAWLRKQTETQTPISGGGGTSTPTPDAEAATPASNAPRPPSPVLSSGGAPKWVAEPLWSRGLPWKPMFACECRRGVLVSTYDRKSRHASELHEVVPGAASRVWSGAEETIGPGTEWLTVLHMPAECGRTLLRYDPRDGKVFRGPSVPDGYRYNVTSCFWRDRPVVGATGPGKPAIVFSAADGARLATLPLAGLVAGMAEDGAGVLWAAISTGQWGVCNSNGLAERAFKAASVAWWLGVGIVAGGMDDGRIYRRGAYGWETVLDLRCSKVNRLCYVAADNALLAAGSKPDTFVRIGVVAGGAMAVETIARFEDEKQERSDEQFDACIAPCTDGTVLLGRATGQGCEFYRARRAG